MFLCVTPYGLVYMCQLFYQKCRILLHGSEDFMFLQDLDICLQGYTASHHTHQHGTEPYVVTVLSVLAGWTANCCYGLECHGQSKNFVPARHLQCSPKTLYEHVTYSAVNESEI